MESPPELCWILRRLPVEILLKISKASEDSSETAPAEHLSLLFSLSATCRAFQAIFEPELYKYDIQRNDSSAMNWAAFHGNLQTLEKAVSYGADIDARGQHLGTCHEVRAAGRLCSPLKDEDEDKQATLDGKVTGSPIHFAIYAQKREGVVWLLEHGADLGQVSTDIMCVCSGMSRFDETCYCYWSPLHLSVITGNNDFVDLVLQHGAESSTNALVLSTQGNKTQMSYTPLHWAARLGDSTIIRTLLRY
ncbi:ankyrin repeat-containing domain protein [Podospora aff. communis PSN243]|uniref:Ankyrin repeat-containing domain protein n=1 Tax=Podospora aff. communis PSN243 TaxID=3040156 RepID=A0AAV9GEK0_9PEZI|nr:ankyrin repeat-containing domain protein [Podospora aff. communis PSN243]